MLDDGNSSAYPWSEDQQLLVVANATWSGDRQPSRDPLYIVVPMTCVYAVILVSGVVGNLSTCVVISRNKHMHTATNYYLFSLAVSDLLLLTMGLPPEMYYIWSRYPYVFGEFFCRLTSFATETSANATVLTVTAFTVERYIAICHPFLSYTVSKLSRAVKFIFAIWVLALCLAFPQAIQFGVVTFRDANGTEVADSAQCSIKWQFLEHAFHISTGVLFVLPMTLITVLYALIGLKLRRSRLLKGPPSCAARNQNHVVRMLVAVVVAFFICWAPFHCQRLLAVYASGREENGPAIVFLYTALTYISGILYFVSTTVNPLLYHTMSNKFRQAFKTTLAQLCSPGRGGGGRRGDSRCYSTLARPSARTLVARTSLTSTAAHPQQRQPSVAAIHDPRQAPARRSRTDTISNSSLKDVVAGEFAGYELVRYMGELNGR